MFTNTPVMNEARANVCLSQCKPNPRSNLRLFCFPYAGGAATIYRTWPDNLPATIEVFPIELPGRGRRLREPAFRQLPHLVDAVAEALAPHLDKPFAFFGHSMGALISFELARRLKQNGGQSPRHLFVSGRRAPHTSEDERRTYHLPEDEFIADILRLNGTPKEVLTHPELLQLLIPLLRTDFEVCQTYQYHPGARLDCPITVLGGIGDPDVRREHLEAWREMTTADCTVCMYPGDHFFIHSSQDTVFRTLAHRLEQISNQLAASQRG